MTIVFMDVETTGLDAERHDVWEIAIVDLVGNESVWHVEPDLSKADSTSLRLTHYHERYATERWTWEDPHLTAQAIAETTAGLLIAGAVPSFDAIRVERFLRLHGQAPAWHYHLVDVEALAAGKLGLAPPWDSEELSTKVGVEPTQFGRHTALGDARWAKAIYEAAMGQVAGAGVITQ